MTHKQARALIDQIRESLKDEVPYEVLTSRNSLAGRQSLLRLAAEAIAGTKAGSISLISNTAGVQNVTASRICYKYDLMAATNGDNQSLSREKREWAVNALSLLTPDASNAEIARMCKAGKRICTSARDFGETGDPIYVAPSSDYPGRKRAAISEEIKEAWVEASTETSRRAVDGTVIRAIQGGNARVARSICESKGCSITTAYKYRPANITLARKKTDLCPFCEGLRQVRRELVGAAIGAGAQLVAPPQTAGQREMADVGDRAAVFCRELEHVSPATKKLIDHYSSLKWHEGLNATLEAEMREDLLHHTTVVFDYSSNVALSSMRGDVAEFFRKRSLSLFGAMVTRPRSSGGYDAFYVNVFSPTKSHTSQFAAASLKVALGVAVEHGVIPVCPHRLCLYSDKARHFVSRELAYEALFRVAPQCDDVSLTYHACHHGKTPLDAHFSHLKRAVDAIPVEKWPADIGLVQQLVIDGLKHVANSATAFLSVDDLEPCGRKMLLLQDIACVQRLRAKRYGPGGKLLTIEGKPTPIRTKDCQVGIEAGIEEECELEGGCSENIEALCVKLEKQKDKRRQYQI